MKNCKECGAPLKENAQFCGACGAKIEKENLTKNCIQCGAKIENGERFCSSCGMNVEEIENSLMNSDNLNDSEPISENSTKPLTLCCPECGNKNLQVTTEIGGVVSGGVINKGKYGGISSVSNATFWICPKCGKKFRHLDGLKEEIKTHRNLATLEYAIGWIAGLFIFILFAAFSASTGLVLGGIVLGFFLLLGSIMSKSASKYERTLHELEEGMRKFQ